MAKFKADMGDRLRIATEHGTTYELFSNTPIPESIKQFHIVDFVRSRQTNLKCSL